MDDADHFRALRQELDALRAQIDAMILERRRAMETRHGRHGS